MRNMTLKWICCGFLALALAACSSVPHRIAVLEEAQATVSRVDQDPLAGEVAGDELQDAKLALRRAELAHAEGDDLDLVRHEAAMALRHAEIADERIAEERAQRELAQSEARRKAIVLEAREHEAERAKALARAREHEADLAKTIAVAREAEAEQAKALAEERRQEAEMSQLLAAERSREAELRTAEAKEAKQMAAEQAAEAQQAKALAEQRSHEIEAREREADQANQRAEAALQEARELEAALAELQAERTDRGMVLTLGDVLFDTDKAELKPGADLTLDRLVAFMNDYPERELRIEGHTDSRGPDEYNLTLSERRANAVRVALIARGVSAERLQSIGLGERYPVASNDSSAGQQQNRRVEIVVSDAEGEFPPAAVRTAGR
ncbi:MAG: OmpA family protein [Xanthomonadales bacterium]|nr:OmpA family protein [Xanthomonadales bacterium]